MTVFPPFLQKFDFALQQTMTTSLDSWKYFAYFLMEQKAFCSSTELKSNPYTWNKFTNTLFIDNPVGTGFSVVDDSGLVKNETEVADDLYRFLQLFLLKYPKFRHRSVFLTGESYGGHYLPSFGKRIIEGNADTSSINF